MVCFGLVKELITIRAAIRFLPEGTGCSSIEALMRSLFTIHAGEYLAGLHIQQQFKFNVWVPAKDAGIDLLVTDRENCRCVSLQVKYGKDFLPAKSAKVQKKLRCFSWFTLNTMKLDESRADLWVFVLHSFKNDEPDFLIIPKAELRKRMTAIHRSKSTTIQSYLCSTESGFCWEVRAPRHDYVLSQVADGLYKEPKRDFTKYLNKAGWDALTKKLRT